METLWMFAAFGLGIINLILLCTNLPRGQNLKHPDAVRVSLPRSMTIIGILISIVGFWIPTCLWIGICITEIATIIYLVDKTHDAQ